MSENRKSFFSSIPGLVTGLAGLLTGIVGLVTVLIQLDVIGGKDADDPPPGAVTTTTVVGQAPASGGPTTTVAGRFAVEPASLKLQATERQKAVTVKNTGAATLTVMAPEVGGTDRTAFRTDTGCSNVALRPGASCTLNVTLTPSGPLKTYNAKLLIEARESPQVTEVPIEAVAIL
jgi:hypothetical protein